MNCPRQQPDRSRARRQNGAAIALAMLSASFAAVADASEMASLAVEIARTAVVMHHHAINPRSVQPTRVTINHQGDVCHFEAIVVWTSGPFGAQLGSTPRRAVVYGSLVNRSELRRLFDLEYVEAPDRPWIGCDNSPKVISYWNSVFARGDTMAMPRELGQPLHRSMQPQLDCEHCPHEPLPTDDAPPQAARPASADGQEILEGQALAEVLNRDRSVRSAGAETTAASRTSWRGLPPIRTGRRPANGPSETAIAIPADVRGAR